MHTLEKQSQAGARIHILCFPDKTTEMSSSSVNLRDKLTPWMDTSITALCLYARMWINRTDEQNLLFVVFSLLWNLYCCVQRAMVKSQAS